MDSKAFGRDTERFFWFCCSECISVTANASALCDKYGNQFPSGYKKNDLML